jgi:hypothetical protein
MLDAYYLKKAVKNVKLFVMKKSKCKQNGILTSIPLGNHSNYASKTQKKQKMSCCQLGTFWNTGI